MSIVRHIIRYVILFPILVVFIAFGVANRSPVTLSLDPFAPEQPAITIENIPLYVLIFAVLLIGIILGGAGAWFSQGKWRRRARDSRYEAAKLRQEADRLKEAAKSASGPALPAPDGKRAA